jgi:hypothetical protein
VCGAHLFVLSIDEQGGLEWWWWQQQQREMAPNFLSITWHGKAFHGLGVQDVESLILVGALFLPSVAPTSEGGFGVMELMLSASVP